MPDTMNFARSVIMTVENLPPRQRKLVSVLCEEVEKRSRQKLELKQYSERRSPGQPVIVLGTNDLYPAYPPEITALLNTAAIKPEGFQLIAVNSPNPLVVIHGADERGLLYGIGKLLRISRIKPGSFLVPESVNIMDSPCYPLRGHQLGYRPKTNAYDAWTEAIYGQYIRELALFGANSIEILPPRTDDDTTGPHIKTEPLEMMQNLSEIIDSYGLDVWIWYPNMGKDYARPETVRAELAEREEIFSSLKRIDAVFIPGGDPGDLTPDELFAWAEKVAALLRKYHPRAGLWLSPQAFAPTAEWLNSFYDNVKREPEWLTGLVHGPWIKTTIKEMRKLVPAKYPIRNYPDITHSLFCQYPPPNWDPAFAKSLGRECVNPRPVQEKRIHNLYKDFFVGSLSYSEGINDDVNKFVWSGQDWNPDTPVIETLRDYARLFIDPDRADDLAQGIMALERNFDNPVAINKEIATCLCQWQDLERELPFIAMTNYRFQLCLLRAHYDAYIKRRLAYETELEFEALEILENTSVRDFRGDAKRVIDILDKSRTCPVGRMLREKCASLADLLFANIGAQLTVTRHKALNWIRGAFMDSIDTPLNDARYITAKLEELLGAEDNNKALELMKKTILNRTNPGPGGFYDSMGDNESWRRFPDLKDWQDDPGNTANPFKSFPIFLHLMDDNNNEMKGIPQAWLKNASVLYEMPMRVRYENLDPEAAYTLTIKYNARRSEILAKTVQLTANGVKLEFDAAKTAKSHPLVCFDLPEKISANGTLDLVWVSAQGDSLTSVAEIFLTKRR